MKRTQMTALLAGAALGLTGVALAVVLSRKEGRDAARKLLNQAAPVADQARRAGGYVAKTAVEQYQTISPRAADALNTVRAQAPQAVDAVVARFPKVSLNGKDTLAGVNA